VALARSLGYTTIVVTNQAGIARGLYTEADMTIFHGALNAALRQSGGWIDAFYHCPYHPQATLPQWQAENHPDRKPNPGMLLRAARDLDIDLAGSVLFGDRDSDIVAAGSAGLRGVLYTGGDLDALLGETLRHGGTSD
jgi:D-glycero-D-manno-heptose 1,7-bisphosphate phosphatase